jgi:hypothetical protein
MVYKYLPMKGVKFIEEEKPGLYECHLRYKVGKAKRVYEIAVITIADSFIKAFKIAELEVYLITRSSEYKIVDNLVTLIIDPIEHIQQPTHAHIQ